MNVHYFNNVGYLTHKFSDNELKPIRDEIFEIKENFSEYESQKHNQHLAGNIKREYSLKKCTEVIKNLTYPIVWEFDRQFNYIKSIDLMVKDSPIELSKCWVNFQKKHEFNPFHTHSGLFSFVVWMKIPARYDKEKKLPFVDHANCAYPNTFQLFYTNSSGRICTHDYHLNPEDEGTMLFFTANRGHQVYPFYTSNKTRVSISGNIILDVNQVIK